MKFRLASPEPPKFPLCEDFSQEGTDIKDTLYQVLEEHNSCYYESTSMCLEMICEKLYYDYNIDASYHGRSIYIGDRKVATVSLDKEGYKLVGMYGYKVFI
jgi:hypothetical protein